MKRIYLDYASLTPIDRDVIKIMKKYSKADFSNPSALYSSAVNSKGIIDECKSKIASIIHAHSDEIIFTSGGTESNHLVLNSFRNKEIIISSIEHSSIINDINNYSNNIKKISVHTNGLLNLEELRNSITENTSLISIIMVNNEIGTVQNISDIAKIIRDCEKKFNKEIIFHIDACQALSHFPIHVEKLNADIITLDSHKIYGPRGMGMLYLKRNTIKIIRNGTDNLPGIAGFAYAMELNEKLREKETIRISNLKKYFYNGLININSKININSDIENSSPHILNISIPNIDSEFLVLQLDAKGIECSTKSACLRDEDESYVLKSILANSHNSIRFSFGRFTTLSNIKKSLEIIKNILIKKERALPVISVTDRPRTSNPFQGEVFN